MTLKRTLTVARLLLVLSALGLASACGRSSEPASKAASEPAPRRSIEAIADDFLAAYLERYPTLGTYYSIPGARHDRLFDNSPEALGAWEDREDAWLAELDAIGEPKDVGSRDWVSYGVMHQQLEGSIATRVCHNELWQASTTTAWYTALPFVFDVQPLDTPDLRQQALTRLGAVAGYIDTEIANLRNGLELGYSAPRITVEAVPEQVRALLKPDNPFLNMGSRADDPAFAKKVQNLFDSQIATAIERFATFIEHEYLPKARKDIALSANPEGAKCYPALVRSFASIQPSAEEIHKLGLQQIAKIHGEMQQLIDQNFGGGPVEDFLRRVNTDPQFTFDSEDAVLKYSQDALAAARAAMPRAFGHVPKTEVVIKPYPAYAESGSGEYHPGSEDGTRPGIFYIAVKNPQHRSRAAQLSTLYHETYPGHHLQVSIALALGDTMHPVAKYFFVSGFGEGWALYSERLADELGLYPTPIDRMSMLSDQGARAARLVIDTGIHTMGWTRQQAVDYMKANTAWASVDIENEINRYISFPGQATSYMLGMLEIRRLRTEAEQQLGDGFDLRAFHDRVLGYGNITLPMLDESIEAWIAAQKGSAN
ncbi:MAG: DUF885 domain-containing protein [Woeseiaceae bacterium]